MEPTAERKKDNGREQSWMEIYGVQFRGNLRVTLPSLYSCRAAEDASKRGVMRSVTTTFIVH